LPSVYPHLQSVRWIPFLKKEKRLKKAYLKAEKELSALYQLAGQIEYEKIKK
jgi:hypothetical protein